MFRNITTHTEIPSFIKNEENMSEDLIKVWEFWLKLGEYTNSG